MTKLSKLPFSIRVVLEAALRQCNDNEITQQDVKNIAAWTPFPLPRQGEQGRVPAFPFCPPAW